MESVYYGVPIFGFPLDLDQFGMCKTLETLGVSIYAHLNVSPDKISHNLLYLLETKSYQTDTELLMKMIEFEETRSGKGAGYWAEYIAKFGVS